MLIIQHIWTKWTKATRGADSAVRRPRLAEAYELPAPAGLWPVMRHEIRALESEAFRIVEEAGETDRESWPRHEPHRNNALDWRLHDDRAEIILRRPSEYRQQTKWPALLPDPLFVLAEGETARIEWNGRFRSSTFGSNRSSYYEQHVYWLAVARSAEPRLFLDAEPRKHIDLRAHIY